MMSEKENKVNKHLKENLDHEKKTLIFKQSLDGQSKTDGF